MKKQLAPLVVTLLLLFLLGGCTQKETPPSQIHQEKILGEWTESIPGTPLIVTMNFITNMSYYESINNTRIWGTYTMTNETITLRNNDVANTFEYTFSNNWTSLTLVQVGTENIRLELTRPEG
jgi:hypothetical protein